MKDTRFARLVLLVNGLVPLTLLLWDVYRKQVGANPLEFVTRTTGMLTLVFLLISLAVTPLRRITGLNWLVRFRQRLLVLRLRARSIAASQIHQALGRRLDCPRRFSKPSIDRVFAPIRLKQFPVRPREPA